MYGLDLFSGIGGLTKALEGYVRPIAYCENDRHAQGVLLSRMATGDLPLAPIWDDVRTLRATDLPIYPEIIFGGFPCQDLSCAGRGAGLEGKRSGLFFEITRLVGEIRPRFVFLENVSAITVRGSERVVGELCKLGYDARWGILSASDVGANHRRERWWLLAHARHGSGRDIGPAQGGQDAPEERSGDHDASGRSGEQPIDVAHADRQRTKRAKPEHRKGRGPLLCGEGAGAMAHTQSGKDLEREPRGLEETQSDRPGFDAAARDGGADVSDTTCGREGTIPEGQRPKGKGTTDADRRGEDVSDAQDDGPRWRIQLPQSGKSPRHVAHPAGKVGARLPRRKKAQHPEPRLPGWWELEPDVGRVAHGVPLRVDRLRGLGNAVALGFKREAFERLMGIK